MRKSVWISLMMIITCAYQAGAQWKFGGNLSLGSRMGISDASGNYKMGVGLNARANYSFGTFDVSNGVTCYIPGTPKGISMQAYQVNSDLHIALIKYDSMSFYGVTGLNLSYATASVDQDSDGDLSNNSICANRLGLDMGFGVRSKKFYFEEKYDSSFNQTNLSVGMFF